MRTPNTLIAIALLAITACSEAPDGSPNKDVTSPWEAPEDQMVSARRVNGEVAQGDAALAGSGTLSTATTAQIVSIADDGSTSSHGSADIAADGSFSIDADGMTRTFLVVLLDADAQVVGSTIVTANSNSDEDIDAGEITAETTVEAQVWTEVVSEAGYGLVVSSEVRARIDAATADAAEVWFDENGESSTAFSAMAEAVIAASSAREDQASSTGLDLDAQVRGELRGWLSDAEDEGELAAAVDGAFAANGMGASDRSVLAARTEATFRAALVGAFSDSSESGEALLDLSLQSSTRVEAWGHSDAWSELAADAETHVDLMASIFGSLEDGAEGTENRSALVSEVHAALDLSLDGLFDDVIDGSLGLNLGVMLGLGSNASQEDTAEAFGAWMTELRADVEAQVQLASTSGENASDATGEIWVDLAASVDAALESANAEDDSELRAAVMLSVGAFVSAE